MKLLYSSVLAGCALAQNYCNGNSDENIKCPDGELKICLDLEFLMSFYKYFLDQLGSKFQNFDKNLDSNAVGRDS